MKKENTKSSKSEKEKLLKKNRFLARWLVISVLFSGGLLTLQPINDKIIEEKIRNQYREIEYEETGIDWYTREENKRYPYTFKELEERATISKGEYFEDAMLVHKIDERTGQVEFVHSGNHNNYKVVARVDDLKFYELKEGMIVKAKGELDYAHQQGNWNYLQITPQDFSFYPDDSLTISTWKGKEIN